MLRVGMARKSKRTKHTKRSRSRRHSRRCIFRYKHTRKQHRNQKRQRGGVNYEPTIATVSGFPVVSKNNEGKASVSVQGFGQMSPRQYLEMAGKGELVVDN